jgi:hypothetical protein
MSTPWGEFLKKTRKDKPLPGRLLCLDPGETTGWSLFINGELEKAGQFRVDNLNELFMLVTGIAPDHIVMEDYKVYAHRAQQHIGSGVTTVQYIGVFKLAAEQLGIPLTLQMAHLAKGFVNDKKLQMWELYQTGARHANDSIRHGIYYLLFGKRVSGS